ESVQSGHVYLPKSEVSNDAFNILNTTEVTEDLINEVLLLLNEKKKIKIKKDNDIYIITIFYVEDDFISHFKHIISVAIAEKIKKDNDIYLITLYYAEDCFSSHLKRIMSVPIDEEVPTADLLKIAGEVEESDVISYGDKQFTAISQAINSKVMILTGGPGTGK